MKRDLYNAPINQGSKEHSDIHRIAGQILGVFTDNETPLPLAINALCNCLARTIVFKIAPKRIDSTLDLIASNIRQNVDLLREQLQEDSP